MTMTAAQAAEEYIAAKAEESAAAARVKAAKTVLLDWFKKHPKSRTYRNRISYAVMSRMQLDIDAVKAELGDRLPEFQRPVEYEQLSILKS